VTNDVADSFPVKAATRGAHGQGKIVRRRVRVFIEWQGSVLVDAPPPLHSLGPMVKKFVNLASRRT